ncbi:hypothetical protein K1T71_012858 [Dendrolimus kikuchii]|uniref:Uncharacterized protein n=1 Tax=Dendrolimus kikuchii TaxID=765133 RepID=A0ACC1CI99_9NEOP|nr:hypothetical protein K1T71_012858 [Dendrolimus kikuchii]
MAGDEMWLRKYRRNILHATGDGNISYINSGNDSDDDVQQDIFNRYLIHLHSADTELKTPAKKRLRSITGISLPFRKRAFDKGANPNATCYQNKVNVAHIAAWKSEKTLKLLLHCRVDKSRTDELGRTPLHFAAWAGNLDSMALLTYSSEAESIDPERHANTDVDDVETIPVVWYDNHTHNCPNDELPPIQKGWTPLHAASSNVQLEAVNHLLSIDPDSMKCDETGCTPLDVIASSWEPSDINADRFTDLVATLIQSGGTFASSQELRNKYNSPLHTALKLKSPEMLLVLLENGAQVDCIDDSGDTILHVCVINKLENCLKVLADSNHIEPSLLTKVINKKNNKGENVLHTAMKHNWLPGVHLAMKLISDIITQTNDGNTAIHFIADIGDIDVLETILSFDNELLSFKFKLSYFFQIEIPITFATIILALSLPSFVEDSSRVSDWSRYLATAAVLLSWLQMLLIISKFPQWGYYVQMFGKVSSIVIKVLLTFSFIVIGFSLSFMIQFHFEGSFTGPWTAFIKTMVMMMSEFDYDDLFKDQPNNAQTKVNRILFIVFLIFGGIVLMNLLVGLAVNDLQALEMHGHIRRIEKQVEFLASLDTIMENPIVKCIFPKNSLYLRNKDLGGAMLTPCNPNWGSYKAIPQKLRNAIFHKIQTKNLKNSIIEDEVFKSKLEDIYNFVDKDVVSKENMNAKINDIAAKMRSFEDILSRLDKKLVGRKGKF